VQAESADETVERRGQGTSRDKDYDQDRGEEAKTKANGFDLGETSVDGDKGGLAATPAANRVTLAADAAATRAGPGSGSCHLSCTEIAPATRESSAVIIAQADRLKQMDKWTGRAA
jgi:hypothetical protein